MIVPSSFFDREPLELAQALIGLVLRHKVDHAEYGSVWLSARIIETEAYFKEEKGSHSSLGFTEKRKAMFMAPGTIYMYYSRGGDSINFSARGDGNGVLIKSGLAFTDHRSPRRTLKVMQQLNPVNGRTRPLTKLCSGQTLICRSLGLKVPEWNQQQLKPGQLILDDVGRKPEKLVQTKRLGIPPGRDDHLPYRFIEFAHVKSATRNPLKGEYKIIIP